MKGGIEWNLTISGAERYIKDIYLMLLSGEIHIYAILYKSCSIKQIIFNKYATISHGGVWETQVCSYYYLNLITFSFLIDIIDNIIYASVLVTWYGRISDINTFWYNFDTSLCQFLETSDRCLGIVQLLKP